MGGNYAKLTGSHPWQVQRSTLSFVIIFLPLTVATAFISPITIPPTNRPSSFLFVDSNDNNILRGNSRDDSSALHRLDLTPDEAARIQKRIKQPLTSTDEMHMQRNLRYLEDRLDLSAEELRAMALAFPPVLTMRFETRLKPAIAFFDDALNGGSFVCGNNSDTYTTNLPDQSQNCSRLAAFLCQSPNLLEYNAAKRLRPRLARVQAQQLGEDAGDCSAVDEEKLRSIATLTDSRFDAWLKKDDAKPINGNVNSGDENDGKPIHDWNVDYQDTQRRPDEPSSYVIVSNLQSGGNIGNIVRSASIFGCEECIVVGQKRYRLAGDHGSRFDLPRHHMWSHTDARDYLHEKGVRIYGIEIMADAAPIMRYDPDTGFVRFPFDRQWSGAAFIFGNEGQGLSPHQREICDEYLFIPQTRGGTEDGGGSASMNVACAAAVILQAYCTWAGYSVATLQGEKFVAA